MPVRPPNARADHAALERLARERYGEEARLTDAPRAGSVGEVDAKDRFSYEKGGRTVETVLGVKRSEDLAFRKLVVDAAYDLAASGAQFSGAASSDAVNEKLWTYGFGGRMQVRKFLANGKIGSPAAALEDIFKNGHKYAFECATAMMVIYHKAILDHVGAEKFDAMFSEPKNLAFFRWSIEDDDWLAVKKLAHKQTPLHPGSHYYYENPDASDENSAFGGENVIYLGEGRFYAHGVVGAEGTYIVTEKELVDSLSALRRRGAKKKPKRIALEMHVDGLALSKRAIEHPL